MRKPCARPSCRGTSLPDKSREVWAGRDVRILSHGPLHFESSFQVSQVWLGSRHGFPVLCSILHVQQRAAAAQGAAAAFGCHCKEEAYTCSPAKIKVLVPTLSERLAGFLASRGFQNPDPVAL